jgi:hypothetical protein
VGSRHFDALIFGYWEGDKLMYAARTRSGFTPATREQLHQWFQGLETPECPFANLPEARDERWGDGLMAAKMKSCKGLKRLLVGRFEFVEWTRISTCGIRDLWCAEQTEILSIRRMNTDLRCHSAPRLGAATPQRHANEI